MVHEDNGPQPQELVTPHVVAALGVPAAIVVDLAAIAASFGESVGQGIAYFFLGQPLLLTIAYWFLLLVAALCGSFESELRRGMADSTPPGATGQRQTQTSSEPETATVGGMEATVTSTPPAGLLTYLPDDELKSYSLNHNTDVTKGRDLTRTHDVRPREVVRKSRKAASKSGQTIDILSTKRRWTRRKRKTRPYVAVFATLGLIGLYYATVIVPASTSKPAARNERLPSADIKENRTTQVPSGRPISNRASRDEVAENRSSTMEEGRLAMSEQRWGDAEEAYRAVLRGDPRDAEAMNRLAWCLLSNRPLTSGRVEEATALAVGLLSGKSKTTLPTWWNANLAAAALAANGDFDEAYLLQRTCVDECEEEFRTTMRAHMSAYASGRLPKFRW